MQVPRHPRRAGSSVALIAAFGTIVLAFMGISLAITATGTARFAVAMGYPRRWAMRSAVCSTSPRPSCRRSDHAVHRRALVSRHYCSAWLGLVTYSCLATHATVTSAIAATERIGSMEDGGPR